MRLYSKNSEDFFTIVIGKALKNLFILHQDVNYTEHTYPSTILTIEKAYKTEAEDQSKHVIAGYLSILSPLRSKNQLIWSTRSRTNERRNKCYFFDDN